MIRTGLNIKIVMHWIAIVLGLISINIVQINHQMATVLNVFLISTLVFNQATYLSIRNSKLMLIKKVLFVVPVYRKSIHLSNINEIHFIKDNDIHPEFEGSVISSLLAGSYFYDSGWRISVDLFCNETFESDLSLSDSDVLNLQKYIAKHFNNLRHS